MRLNISEYPPSKQIVSSLERGARFISKYGIKI